MQILWYRIFKVVINQDFDSFLTNERHKKVWVTNNTRRRDQWGTQFQILKIRLRFKLLQTGQNVEQISVFNIFASAYTKPFCYYLCTKFFQFVFMSITYYAGLNRKITPLHGMEIVEKLYNLNEEKQNDLEDIDKTF